MIILKLNPGLILRTKPAPERNPDWWERNCETHPLMAMVNADPDLKVIRVTDLMPVEKILASEYYREFVEPEGWLFSFGMFFRGVKKKNLIGMLAVNRRPDQCDFSKEEMEFVLRNPPSSGECLSAGL